MGEQVLPGAPNVVTTTTKKLAELILRSEGSEQNPQIRVSGWVQVSRGWSRTSGTGRDILGKRKSL